MEIRELRYFLAIAKEESISKAADYLFITQPSLSRQMQNLEKEIGRKLFVRGNKKITLTETGVLLRKRAEEILDLHEKTQKEIAQENEENIGGDIFIGGGESYAVETVAKVAKKMQEKHPGLKFHFFSGDSFDVGDKLNKGLIDFGILVEPTDLSRFDFLRLPKKDTWGVLMRKDCPLAQNDFVAPDDLVDLPLILSNHTLGESAIFDWFGCESSSLKIVATYNLIYNASILVKTGVGCAVGLDKIINTTGDSELCFRPFKPKIETSLAFAWKRYQVFSKGCQQFLKELQERIEEES